LANFVKRATPVAAAILAFSVFALSGCGEHPASSNGAPPIPTTTAGSTKPGGTTSPGTQPNQGSPTSLFASTDQQLSQLVAAEAAWHAPSSLQAGETSRIGLSIGSSATLTKDIQSLLPSTSTRDAGTVAVGPNVSATLEVDAADASVDPSTAINASTGSDIQLLWTWYLHPKHPTGDLEVTAHIAVTLSNNTVKTVDVPLSIRVDRTASYTIDQLFSDWETWVSIVTVAGGALLAVWRRRQRLLKLVNQHGDGDGQTGDVQDRPHGGGLSAVDGPGASKQLTPAAANEQPTSPQPH
jgi:hypothetical protein